MFDVVSWTTNVLWPKVWSPRTLVLLSLGFLHHLFKAFLGDDPGLRMAISIFIFDMMIYNVLCLVFHGLFYDGGPLGKAHSAKKFNPRQPSAAMVAREFRRTQLNLAIGAAYDAACHHALLSRGAAPPCSAAWSCLLFVLFFFWYDVHFHFTHRLLHWKPLWTRIHYIHHQSTNPDPWSAMSFHGVEGALYFSCFLLALARPLGASPAHFVFLVVLVTYTPLFGHLGFGVYGGSRTHYLHHTEKDVNFGAWFMVADIACGTLK